MTNVSRKLCFNGQQTQEISLVVIKRSKGCRFVPKIHQNTLGGRAVSRPAGSLCAPPDAVAAMGPTYEEEGGEGRGYL